MPILTAHGNVSVPTSPVTSDSEPTTSLLKDDHTYESPNIYGSNTSIYGSGSGNGSLEISKRQLYALCALPVSLLQSAAAERLFAMLASDAYYACLLRQLPTDELMQVFGIYGVVWGE